MTIEEIIESAQLVSEEMKGLLEGMNTNPLARDLLELIELEGIGYLPVYLHFVLVGYLRGADAGAEPAPKNPLLEAHQRRGTDDLIRGERLVHELVEIFRIARQPPPGPPRLQLSPGGGERS